VSVSFDTRWAGAGDQGGGPPWDTGGPQPALADVLAIALARRNYEVTAIDILRVAIDMARARAVGEGLTVHFEVQDATDLSLPSAPFDSVFDSGLLHSPSGAGVGEVDDYLVLLPGLAAPGATVFVLAVSLEAGQGWGVTEEFLRASVSAFGPMQKRWQRLSVPGCCRSSSC
jgi:SAM-dependent methyltransferase